ncbi:endonuclease domain-containing protein [Enterobacter asburiae]|uniref:endonuclease domain-containing protein n=1 Tax=Scandinavium sp. UTDF21-P1B TaxID=3446379 RepID=UPI003487D33B
MENHKYLRSHQTSEENRLWYLLRAKRFYGYKFKRQMPVGPYIADFACFRGRLIVELDGGQHADDAGNDAKRTAYLSARGWRVLRFWNNEFRMNEEAVLMSILEHLTSETPSP